MAGKIYGVSLGPGDPGLLTVKGLQILRQVDKIYFAGSLSDKGDRSSYSLKILEHYQLEKEKLHGMYLVMSDDRSQAEKTYSETFQKMLQDYEKGLQVAFVSEGDISFYSTFAYLLKHIHHHKLDVEVVAGVPSFLTGAAANKMPLAILNEKIAILPRMKDSVQLESYLEEFDTIVLIKVRSVLKEIEALLVRKSLNIVYCERLGTDQEYITTNIEDISKREIPYFSLLIIKKSI